MAEPQKLAGLHRSHNRLSHITLSRRPASGRAPRSSCEDTHFGWVFATRPTTPAEVGPTCANGQQASAQTCALGWPAGTGNYGIITKGDAHIPGKQVYKPVLILGTSTTRPQMSPGTSPRGAVNRPRTTRPTRPATRTLGISYRASAASWSPKIFVSRADG